MKSGTSSELLRKPATFSLAEVFGHSVVEEKEKIKKKISVVPQESNTFDRLTVGENVELISDIESGGGDL